MTCRQRIEALGRRIRGVEQSTQRKTERAIRRLAMPRETRRKLQSNAVRAAENRVEAGIANLRGTESAIFSAVVGAYMDVIRDEAIVDLNRAQAGVLQVNLEATRDRFEIGDLKRGKAARVAAKCGIVHQQVQGAMAQSGREGGKGFGARQVKARASGGRDHLVAVIVQSLHQSHAQPAPCPRDDRPSPQARHQRRALMISR